jgi:C-terminal processing protease CtpA/Prc
MLRLAFILLSGSAILFGADLTGTWRGDAGPSNSVTVKLQQTGNTLSGTEEIQGKLFPLRGGHVDGDRFTFIIDIPARGRLRPMSFTGTPGASGEIRLQGDLPLVLKRVEPAPDAGRIERLASLIRLWGTIRFFHPWIASRPIDWDSAFIAAVPPAENAASRSDFARAISGMLATLHDSETLVLADGAPEPLPIACQCREITRSGFVGTGPSTAGGYFVDWENVPRRTPFIMTLWDGVRVAIRTAEPVSASTDIKDTDNPYAGDLPSREYRLLGLARYWNAIHYFYGYPDSLGALDAWDTALDDFIPQFEAAQTGRDYRFAIGRLAARTHDGHSFVGGGTVSLLSELGLQPDVTLRHIGGGIIVTASGVPRIAPGDIVRTIDGMPAADREKSLMALFPWSTLQSGRLIAERYLLAGPEPRVRVGIRKPDGSDAEIELERNQPYASVRPAPVMEAAFGTLPSGLGYIDLTRLRAGDVDRAFDSMMEAPGIIFDLRGSAAGGAFARIAARLTDKPVTAALLRRRVWHGPDPREVTVEDSRQDAYPAGKAAYRGAVAVLIDAGAFSQAEHTALFLEASANVIFAGTPTAGTDGEVTGIVLPGAIPAHFAAMSIRHADGRPLQCVGILPDIWVEPTPAAIQQGRDEVLARAVNALLQKP